MNPDKPVVFVVDDDYRVREALSSLISSAGLGVATFGSAAEFLESEKPDSPACMVLDLELPGTSGLELQQQLIAGEALPIILRLGSWGYPSFRARHEGRRYRVAVETIQRAGVTGSH